MQAAVAPAEQGALYQIVERQAPTGPRRGVALYFHEGQITAWTSPARIVAMIAGSQGGKT